jgi:hypothetical protein
LGSGVGERAGNDLGRPVIATHRVDREPNPAWSGGSVRVRHSEPSEDRGDAPLAIGPRITGSKECLPSGP